MHIQEITYYVIVISHCLIDLYKLAYLTEDNFSGEKLQHNYYKMHISAVNGMFLLSHNPQSKSITFLKIIKYNYKIDKNMRFTISG